jgi:PKD domain
MKNNRLVIFCLILVFWLLIIQPVSALQVLPTSTPPGSASPKEGSAPLLVMFKYLDTTWWTSGNRWNFGDGKQSNVQNPTHTYTNSGNYQATLTAINIYGNSRTTNIANIMVSPTPKSGGGTACCSEWWCGCH